MRVILRDVKTGEYWGSHDDWVETIDEAKDFAGGIEAIEFAIARKMYSAEVLHVFPEREFNFGSGAIGMPITRPHRKRT